MLLRKCGDQRPMKKATGHMRGGVIACLVLLLTCVLMAGAVSAEGGATSTSADVSTYEELITNLSKTSDAPSIINLTTDIYAPAQISVNRSVTIDGRDNTITASLESGNAWSTDNGKKNLLLIEQKHDSTLSTPVTLKNIRFESNATSATDKKGAHGVQAYNTGNDVLITLENVVLNNSAGSGLNVNGANVTLTNVTIENSAWNQSVDVSSGSGVSYHSNLTIDSDSTLNDLYQVVNDKTNGIDAQVSSDSYKPYDLYYAYHYKDGQFDAYSLQKRVWSNDDDFSTEVRFVVDKRDSSFAVASANLSVLNTSVAIPALHCNVTDALKSYVVDNAVVTQLQELTLTESIKIEKAITFDGDNKQITVNGESLSKVIEATSDVEFKNLNITASGAMKSGEDNGAFIYATSALTIKNSKINLNSVTSATSYVIGIFAKPGSESKNVLVESTEIVIGEGSKFNYGIVISKDHSGSVEIKDNFIILKKSKDQEGVAAKGSTSAGIVLKGTNGATGTEIRNNTITAASDFRAKGIFTTLLPKTDGTTEFTYTIVNNTFDLTTTDSNGQGFVFDTMLSGSMDTGGALTLEMYDNTVKNATSAIVMRQSSSKDLSQYTLTLKGNIYNNDFAGVSGDFILQQVNNAPTGTIQGVVTFDNTSSVKFNTTPTTEFGTNKKITVGQTHLAGNWWGKWSSDRKAADGYLTFTDVTAAKTAGLPVADLVPLVTVGQPAGTLKIEGNFSIELGEDKSETLTVKLSDGTPVDSAVWTVSPNDVITLKGDQGSSITYSPLKIGNATVTVTTKDANNNEVTVSAVITVYKVAAPAIDTKVEQKNDGNVSVASEISGKSTITVEGTDETAESATITDAESGITVLLTYAEPATVTKSGDAVSSVEGKVSTAVASYPETEAPASKEANVAVSYTLSLNLNKTTALDGKLILPTINPVFKEEIAEIATTRNANYLPVSMITAEAPAGSSLEDINNNLTKINDRQGGIVLTFTIPKSLVDANGGAGKVRVLHIKEGDVVETHGTTPKPVGDNYQFTVHGESFSNYVAVIDTYVPPVPPVPPVSSGGGGNMDGALRVLFVTDGGNSGTVVTGLSYGNKVSQPATPVRDGYSFGGWYTDAGCTKPWSFSDSINGDMTLYAKWTSNGSGAVETYTATTSPTKVQATSTVSGSAQQSSQTANPTGTAAATTASAGVSPTMTQAPAPLAGLLLGLFAAGVLIRRRE